MSNPVDDSSIAAFLGALPTTGPRGFEGLTATLCEAATGQRFRLSGSGYQSGQDARAEPGFGNRIKTESKRYSRQTALDLRELMSELTQAASSDPELDLWVLAVSRSVIDQIARPLEELAHGMGVEVLFLDMGTDGLGRLPVLMAAYPVRVREWMTAHGISTDMNLAAALSAIAAHPLFDDVRAQILSKLGSTLLGYDSARMRCRSALNSLLSNEGRARGYFGQALAIKAPTSRFIRRPAINKELGQLQSGQAVRVAVTGEEGSGKTWAVMDWLAETAVDRTSPLVLAFSAKVEHLSSSETFELLLPRLLARWTGVRNEAFWAAKLARWGASPAGYPKLLLVCDGLSERHLNWPLFLRSVDDPLWATALSVVLTDRQAHWLSLRSSLPGFTEIKVGGYNDSELGQALQGADIALDAIPSGLHELIRKPRYCELVCKNFDEMKRESDFSAGRLIWLDIKSRRQDKLGFPMTEDEFVAVIREIAKRYRVNPVFDPGSIKACLPFPDPDGDAYREIVDGLLTRGGEMAPKMYAKEAHLAFGLGMLVAEEVRFACADAESGTSVADQIERWFEPHAEMDLKAKICEAALFHAFVDTTYPSLGRTQFLRYWLKLRNATSAAYDVFVHYVARGPKEFVAVAEQLFAEEHDDGGAEDFLSLAFCIHRDDPPVAVALVPAIDRWLRQIHPCGDAAWSGNAKSREQERQGISARIGHEPTVGLFEVAGERLEFVDNAYQLKLIALAFKVISTTARTPFAASLTAWALGSAITDSIQLRKEFSWLCRLSEDGFEEQLLGHARRLLNGKEEIAHRAAHTILAGLGTSSAALLARAKPLPKTEAEREWSQMQTADPCGGWFAWSDDECQKCMERSDLHVSHVIQRMGLRVIDPDYSIPASLIERTLKHLSTISTSIRSGMSRTVDDHQFEQVQIFLAVRAPKGLVEFIRRVIRTMPERLIENQRSLCFWLPQVGPLFENPEIDAIKRTLQDLYAQPQHWTPISPGNVTTGQWIETFCLMGLLPNLPDSEFVEWALNRPDNSFDEARHNHLVRPLPRKLSELLLASLHHGPSPARLGRLLRLLETSELALSPADRERLKEFAGDDDVTLRMSALRFASEVSDHDLGQRILNLRRHYGGAVPAEEDWGSRLVLRYASELTLDDIAVRVHPAVLAHALAPRGNRPEEVSAFADLLDRIFDQARGAPNLKEANLPRIMFPPEDGPLGVELPQFYDPEPSQPKSANSVESFRQFVAQWNETLQDQGKAAVQRTNLKRWAKVDAIREAWTTTAFQWYGRRICASALEALYDCTRWFVDKWSRLAIHNDHEAQKVRRRLASFFASLSLVLMGRSPSDGCTLFRTLYQDRDSHGVEVTTEFPFAAADSPEVDQLRQDILGECWDDSQLSQIAYYSERHHRHGWLRAEVDSLLQDALLWKRAKGLVLASFTSISSEQFEEMVKLAQIRHTWVEDQLGGLRKNVRGDVLAQYWYRRFLQSPDASEWWGAFEVVRHCGDDRFWNWRTRIEEEDGSTNRERKLAYTAMNEQDIEKGFSRIAERRKHFCGLDIENLDVSPFNSRRA